MEILGIVRILELNNLFDRLNSRPDTAEKTMLKLAQWKLLYLNWHTAAPSHPGRGEAAWKKFL